MDDLRDTLAILMRIHAQEEEAMQVATWTHLQNLSEGIYGSCPLDIPACERRINALQGMMARVSTAIRIGTWADRLRREVLAA